MLCADLINVQWKDESGRKKKGVANLEDIALGGACIQMEEPIAPETQIEMSYPNGKLTGIVRHCEYRDIGYFLGIQFDSESTWSQSLFRPQHMLDPRRVLPRSMKGPKKPNEDTVQ